MSEYCPANDFNYIQISSTKFPRNEGKTEITIGIEKSRSRIIRLMSGRVETTFVENYVNTLNSQLRLCHTRYQIQRSSVYQNYVEHYQIKVTCPFLTSNVQLEEINYYNSFSYCRGTTQVNIRGNRTEMKDGFENLIKSKNRNLQVRISRTVRFIFLRFKIVRFVVNYLRKPNSGIESKILFRT